MIFTMSDKSFTLQPVSEKPSRKYRKGSKYNPILDAFLEAENNLVVVRVEIKDFTYLRTQLAKRIDSGNIETVKVSVVNNVCYIEKK